MAPAQVRYYMLERASLSGVFACKIDYIPSIGEKPEYNEEGVPREPKRFLHFYIRPQTCNHVSP